MGRSDPQETSSWYDLVLYLQVSVCQCSRIIQCIPVLIVIVMVTVMVVVMAVVTVAMMVAVMVAVMAVVMAVVTVAMMVAVMAVVMAVVMVAVMAVVMVAVMVAVMAVVMAVVMVHHSLHRTSLRLVVTGSCLITLEVTSKDTACSLGGTSKTLSSSIPAPPRTVMGEHNA